jgi:hypothetical protein
MATVAEIKKERKYRKQSVTNDKICCEKCVFSYLIGTPVLKRICHGNGKKFRVCDDMVCYNFDYRPFTPR